MSEKQLGFLISSYNIYLLKLIDDDVDEYFKCRNKEFSQENISWYLNEFGYDHHNCYKL